MGKKVSKVELEEIVGVSHQAISDWQQEGMPMDNQGASGHANTYDTADVIRWLRERERRKGTATSARERILAVEAELKEISLAKAKGSLVPVEEVEPAWRNLVLSAAAFMASRASRLAGVLEATPGIEAKRAVLRREDAEFLTKLGVDGERMQDELDAFLARYMTEEEIVAFLARLGG